jgi:hypothetical protein
MSLYLFQDIRKDKFFAFAYKKIRDKQELKGLIVVQFCLGNL